MAFLILGPNTQNGPLDPINLAWYKMKGKIDFRWRIDKLWLETPRRPGWMLSARRCSPWKRKRTACTLQSRCFNSISSDKVKSHHQACTTFVSRFPCYVLLALSMTNCHGTQMKIRVQISWVGQSTRRTYNIIQVTYFNIGHILIPMLPLITI